MWLAPGQEGGGREGEREVEGGTKGRRDTEEGKQTQGQRTNCLIRCLYSLEKVTKLLMELIVTVRPNSESL